MKFLEKTKPQPITDNQSSLTPLYHANGGRIMPNPEIWHSFCDQFDTLIDALVTECRSLPGAPPERKIEKLIALKNLFRDPSFAAITPPDYRYHQDLKESLEAYYILFKQSAVDNIARKRDIANKVLENLEVCSPGLLSHKKEGLAHLSGENSYQSLLARQREGIIQQIVLEHMQRKAINRGAEIHVYNFIAKHLEDAYHFSGFAEIPEDIFANQGYCNIEAEDLPLFYETIKKHYTPENIIHHLAEAVRDELNQALDGHEQIDLVAISVSDGASINKKIGQTTDRLQQWITPPAAEEELDSGTIRKALMPAEEIYEPDYAITLKKPNFLKIKSYLIGQFLETLPADAKTELSADIICIKADFYSEISDRSQHLDSDKKSIIIKHESEHYFLADYLNEFPEKRGSIAQRLLLKGHKDFSHDNLSNADLRGVNLRGVNLCETNLSNVNIKGATLDRLAFEALYNQGIRNFTQVTLVGDFSGAILSDANFTDANLTGVNLRGANFSNAILGHVNLSKAQLGGADISGANFTAYDRRNPLPSFSLAIIDQLLKNLESNPETNNTATFVSTIFIAKFLTQYQAITNPGIIASEASVAAMEVKDDSHSQLIFLKYIAEKKAALIKRQISENDPIIKTLRTLSPDFLPTIH
jgi:hypothetical protein